MIKQPQIEWNEELKTATCILESGENVYYGVATCHPDDFDMCSEKTGTEIAIRRATIEVYRNYRNSIKERLAALNQYYYSINQSKQFNEKSYENRMLQRQIRLLQTDLATAKNLLTTEKESLREYISNKELFYKKIRANRQADSVKNVLADN